MKTLKILPICLLLVACNGQFGAKPAVLWAVEKKSEVLSAARDRVRKDNPYPAALANATQDRQNLELLRKQISELRQTAMARCMALQTRDSDMHPTEAAAVGSSRMTSAGLPANYMVTLRCAKASDGDQLILDLQGRMAGLDSLEEQRRRFDQDLYKRAEQVVLDSTAGYARTKGYQLVVNSESAVLFNETKTVLDVTDGVIDFLNTH
ncbi:hypothetical protein [Pseudomonas sp. dw_358]|uniref:hypothetical protein n=1 Tax=Pseudomonas sp. dw_358 TaxID=2720083 RepID=UPI001BD5D871|nr:hypothetical protein [Pseudomonas sp. dw_358]